MIGATPTWMTIEQVAHMVADDYNDIVQFIIDDSIPYRWREDGVEIWLEGFQICMNELYDLVGDLDRIHQAIGEHDEIS